MEQAPNAPESTPIIIGARAVPPAAPLIDEDAFCPTCGYNLRGLPESRCPECGNEFDPKTLVSPALPWSHRRHLGRFRAFRQTVYMASLQPSRLAREIHRHVDYRDSQRFRWIIVALIYLPLLVATLTDWDPGVFEGLLPKALLADVLSLAIIHLSAIATLAVVTGIPSYFFHPRRQPVRLQNNAVALSYYTLAPLSWAPAIFLFTFAARPFGPMTTLLFYAAGIGLLLIFWWWSLLVLARRGLGLPVSSVLLRVGIGVPILWLVFGSLTYYATYRVLVFFPLVYFSLKSGW